MNAILEDIDQNVRVIRTFALNPWVSKPIIAIWLLWSGMFLCLLSAHTAPAHSDMSNARMIVASDAMPAGCMEIRDGGTDIDCKSEATGTLVLSDLVKIEAIANDLPHRIVGLVRIRPLPVKPLLALYESPADLYLLLCSFLK